MKTIRIIQTEDNMLRVERLQDGVSQGLSADYDPTRQQDLYAIIGAGVHWCNEPEPPAGEAEPVLLTDYAVYPDGTAMAKDCCTGLEWEACRQEDTVFLSEGTELAEAVAILERHRIPAEELIDDVGK